MGNNREQDMPIDAKDIQLLLARLVKVGSAAKIVFDCRCME
jgi:hypothetical protein